MPEHVGGLVEDRCGRPGLGGEIDPAQLGPEVQPVVRAQRRQLCTQRLVPALQDRIELALQRGSPGLSQRMPPRHLGHLRPVRGRLAPRDALILPLDLRRGLEPSCSGRELARSALEIRTGQQRAQ